MPDRRTLLASFSKLEAQRSKLLRTLEKGSPEHLQQAPDSASWSVAQVILHLAVAEEGLMNYVDKKIAVGGHSTADMGAPFRLALLTAALASPLKFKAPKAVALIPAISYAEALERWQQIRERMENTFATIPEAFIGHGLIKHPSAGKFDLVQGTRFVRWHVAHHLPQIKRIVTKVSK